MTDTHSCSYFCDRPACIKAQRDELRDALAQKAEPQKPVVWISADNPPTKKKEYVHDLILRNKYGNVDVGTYDGYARYFEVGNSTRLGGWPVVEWMRVPQTQQSAAQTEEYEMGAQGGCHTCGADGGTSCGIPNCGLLSSTTPPAPAAEPVKKWPFAESPGHLANRMEIALSYFDGDMLAAVRNVFIEQAAPPAPAALTDEQIMGAVARGWCHPKNSHKEMDATLAMAIAVEVRMLLAAGESHE